MDANNPLISAIVATGYDGEIGCRGAIPWSGELPRDMKFFMDTTRNSILIMGRLTADTLKLPLKTRKGIIITTRQNETLERYGHHSSVVGSLEQALSCARELVATDEAMKNIFIIGGAQVYREAMEKRVVDVMYLTTVHAIFKHADAFFRFDPTDYQLINSETHPPDEKNKYGCTFEKYQRP